MVCSAFMNHQQNIASLSWIIINNLPAPDPLELGDIIAACWKFSLVLLIVALPLNETVSGVQRVKEQMLGKAVTVKSEYRNQLANTI